MSKRIDTTDYPPARCNRCGDEVVKEGWFWVRVKEVGTGRATFCTESESIHDVDEDDEE